MVTSLPATVTLIVVPPLWLLQVPAIDSAVLAWAFPNARPEISVRKRRRIIAAGFGKALSSPLRNKVPLRDSYNQKRPQVWRRRRPPRDRAFHSRVSG